MSTNICNQSKSVQDSNNILKNGSQHLDIQHNDTQHDHKKLSITTSSVVLFMLSVKIKPIVQNVIMLSGIVLNVEAPPKNPSISTQPNTNISHCQNYLAYEHVFNIWSV